MVQPDLRIPFNLATYPFYAQNIVVVPFVQSFQIFTPTLSNFYRTKQYSTY